MNLIRRASLFLLQLLVQLVVGFGGEFLLEVDGFLVACEHLFVEFLEAGQQLLVDFQFVEAFLRWSSCGFCLFLIAGRSVAAVEGDCTDEEGCNQQTCVERLFIGR
jgi:hypothetical protein